MSTHELAKQLLALPDVRIVVPRVLGYDYDSEDLTADPVLEIVHSDKAKKKVNCIIISYRPAP